MKVKIAFFILAILNAYFAVCQQRFTIAATDKIINEIDSTVKVRYVAECIQPFFADDGGQVWMKNHYIFDTLNLNLYKCVYELIDHEQIVFYFYNHAFLKAVLTDTSLKNGSYSCEYYLNSDSILHVSQPGTLLKNLWTRKEIIEKSKEYLLNYKGIRNNFLKRR